MNNNQLDEIKKIKNIKVLENESLKKYTSFKLDGKVAIVAYPENLDSLIKLLKYVREENIKYKIIGNGSNLVFICEKYNGVLIKLDFLDDLKINDTTIKVGAGYSLIKLASKVSKEGLTGLEFASGIPGTVGGAVFMNAGAYKSDMGYIVSEVKVLTPKYEVKTLYNRDLNFHYRTSFLQKNPDYICLEATIILKHGKKKDIEDLMEERKKRRIMTQPLEFPSAGSVFRNPEDDFAGRLIESIGLKNKNIGDAYISDKHANFIINKGNSKVMDDKNLIDEVKKQVTKEYWIELKAEQEFVE